jgi:hypothetical protein
MRLLHVKEKHSPTEAKKRETFDALIERRWGMSINPPTVSTVTDEDDWEEYEDNDEKPRKVPDIEDTTDNKGRLLNQQPAYDRLLHSEVLLQHDNKMLTAKVKQRSIGPDGVIAGEYNDNPILNTIVYDVEFPDGTIKEYAANLIAENMLTQVDADRYSATMLDGIIDYKRDEATAVSKEDMYVVTKHRQKHLRKTTTRWKLLIRWKDKTELWIPLKDLKESHPVEVAKFCKSEGYRW